MNWPIRIGLEWLVIAITMFVASQSSNVFVWFGATLIIGSRQHALGIIGHWAMHGILPWSKTLMWACFIPIAIDPSVYGYTHGQHHKYLGILGADPEVFVVRKYTTRWINKWYKSALADAFWLHLDESIAIMKMLTSVRSIITYTIFVSLLYLFIGPVALLWPLSVNGLLLTHRLRAQTEHDHIHNLPGRTKQLTKPSWWKRIVYLPHYTWLHYEHHADQRSRVFEAYEKATIR
jgi:fatty acid desaturase